MSSLRSVDGIIRPLLHVPKSRLKEYAESNGLTWWEDSTNENLKYRRNYIRNVILPRLKETSPEQFERLKQLIRRQGELNEAIDNELTTLLHLQPDPQTLKRGDVAKLPHAIARELTSEWLRRNGKRQFGRELIERLTVALKTAQPHTIFVVDNNLWVRFDKTNARLQNSRG
jgi:tRNA(Ile)-lysidine synthase